MRKASITAMNGLGHVISNPATASKIGQYGSTGGFIVMNAVATTYGVISGEYSYIGAVGSAIGIGAMFVFPHTTAAAYAIMYTIQNGYGAYQEYNYLKLKERKEFADWFTNKVTSNYNKLGEDEEIDGGIKKESSNKDNKGINEKSKEAYQELLDNLVKEDKYLEGMLGKEVMKETIIVKEGNKLLNEVNLADIDSMIGKEKNKLIIKSEKGKIYDLINKLLSSDILHKEHLEEIKGKINEINSEIIYLIKNIDIANREKINESMKGVIENIRKQKEEIMKQGMDTRYKIAKDKDATLMGNELAEYYESIESAVKEILVRTDQTRIENMVKPELTSDELVGLAIEKLEGNKLVITGLGNDNGNDKESEISKYCETIWRDNERFSMYKEIECKKGEIEFNGPLHAILLDGALAKVLDRSVSDGTDRNTEHIKKSSEVFNNLQKEVINTGLDYLGITSNRREKLIKQLDEDIGKSGNLILGRTLEYEKVSFNYKAGEYSYVINGEKALQLGDKLEEGSSRLKLYDKINKASGGIGKAEVIDEAVGKEMEIVTVMSSDGYKCRLDGYIVKDGVYSININEEKLHHEYIDYIVLTANLFDPHREKKVNLFHPLNRQAN